LSPSWCVCIHILQRRGIFFRSGNNVLLSSIKYYKRSVHDRYGNRNLNAAYVYYEIEEHFWEFKQLIVQLPTMSTKNMKIPWTFMPWLVEQHTYIAQERHVSSTLEPEPLFVEKHNEITKYMNIYDSWKPCFVEENTWNKKRIISRPSNREHFEILQQGGIISETMEMLFEEQHK